MRLPVIESCLRCLYCDAERGLCCHRGPGPVRAIEADDGPPPEWCPLRTGPDEERLQAFDAWRELAGTMGARGRLLEIEKAARAVVRWSWPEMPQQWRDDLDALRVALGEPKDGGT